MKIKKVLAIFFTAILSFSLASPVSANSEFSVAINRTSFLAASGESLSLNLNNAPEGAGFYVRQCLSVPEGRPTECNGMGNWVTNPALPITFAVQSTFGDVDCMVSECEIFVRRDHLNPNPMDYSLDIHIPITFSAVGVEVDKVLELQDDSDLLQVRLIGIPEGKGVYVRQCIATSDGSRPTQCNGIVGNTPDPKVVWATLDETYLQFGATNAASQFQLEVNGQFKVGEKTFDCLVETCGLFIRRDHLEGSDTSLDTFVPITFAAPEKKSQSITGWLVSPKKYSVKAGGVKTLANSKMKSNVGLKVTFSTSTPKVCKLETSAKKQKVAFKKSGNCNVTAKAQGNHRYNSKTYSWTFKVK